MSNSRSARRRLAASQQPAAKRSRYPYTAPSLGTVRRWMNQLEAEGDVERAPREEEREHSAGRPGRTAYLWQTTAKGRRRARERDWTVPQIRDMITCAIRDRKPGRVPHLLWAMSMKDPDEAKRIAERLGLLAAEAESASR